jgi:hypothetical protein
MTIRIAKISIFAAAAAVGCSFGPTIGEASYANGVWCHIVRNYNGSGQDVCLAENYNSTPITARFRVSPPPGIVGPVVMAPYQQVRIFPYDPNKPRVCIMISPFPLTCD